MDDSSSKSDTAGASGDSQRFQFGLQPLLGSILALAVELAYLRRFGTNTVGIAALVAVIALAIGAMIGAARGKLIDAMFWSLMGSVFAFDAVIEPAMFVPSFRYAWPLTAALTGACVASVSRDKPWLNGFLRRIVVGAVTSAATLGFWTLGAVGLAFGAVFDIICAALAGALLGLFVGVLDVLERKASIPRYAVACVVAVGAVAANWLGPKIIPGW